MLKTISFTKRYIFALSLIALLSSLAYYNLNHLISSQANDGQIINISSKQGMLSQQIALHAIYYKTENLRENITLMEKAHEQLLSYPMNKELRDIYFEEPYMLDTSVRTYLFHAKRFEENRDGRSLTYILKNSQKLLHDLDLATSVYVEHTEYNTKMLQNVELFIFIFTLSTLFFEALFIFRPANKKIIEDTKEITKQKEYAALIIESNTNAIVTLNEHLFTQTFNHMAEVIFGFTKEEVIGKPFFGTIIAKETLFQSSNQVVTFKTLSNLKNKEEVREIEAIHKKGHTFPIRLSLATNDQKGENIAIISMQDISKEKLKDKIMMQQAKFAALGEMIAIIAHQWRQPLAQLNFNCMYIRNKLTDPALIEETGKNEEIIQFMSETITNFENFYKHVENSYFNPEKAIIQALKLLESSLTINHIKTPLYLDSNLWIYGNPNSLAQVVLSIAQNSVDIIKVKQIDNAFISIAMRNEENYLIILIHDNAGGIKENPINAIFEPFHTNKTKPSTGIGLYMSKLIIENQFHGMISAENKESGALFTITLPLLEKE